MELDPALEPQVTITKRGEDKVEEYRIGGNRKFFLEAKKPAVDISEAVSPAYQLRRYAWSAKLPISILTDFEDFAVYDCRIDERMGAIRSD